MGRHIVLAAVLLLGACGGKSGGPADVRIPATTKVLDAASLALLTAVDPSLESFSFSGTTPLLAALEPGDVLVAGVGPQLPYGALRKISTIDTVGAGLVVHTTAAKLTDAIERGQLAGAVPLTKSSSGGMFYPRDLTSPFFAFNDVTLYDYDGDSSTRWDRVSMSGNVGIDAGPTISIKVEDFALKELTFGLEALVTSKIDLTAGCAVGFDEEYLLGQEYFEPIVFMIGPVPVVLVPKIEWIAGVNGQVSAELSSSITADVTASVGVGYANGGFSPYAELTPAAQFDMPSFRDGASASVKAWVGPRLSILLYGAIDSGPYAQLDGFARAQVATDADPWWVLYAGIEARVGLHLGLDIFGLELNLVDWESDPLGKEVAIAQASGPAPSAGEAIATWSRTYGGPSSDEALTVTPTTDGGAILAGTTLSSAPGAAWVVKLDHLGHVEWERAFLEIPTAGAVAQTGDGGYVVGAGSYGTGAGVGYLLRLDANGDLVWARSYAAPDDTTVDGLAVLADDSIVILGPHGILDAGDFLVAHLDPDGTPRWAKRYGGVHEDTPHSLVVTQSGDLVVAGTTYSYGNSTPNAWVLRLDPDGAIRWQNAFDGGGNDYALAVAEAPDGSLGVGGHTIADGFVYKLTAGGQLQWAKLYDPGSINDELHALASTADGGFIGAGFTGFPTPDLWLCKLDSAGTLVWATAYGGALDDTAGGVMEHAGVGHPLVLTPDGGLLAVGATKSLGAGDYDAWALKTDGGGVITFSSGDAHRTSIAATITSATVTTVATNATPQDVSLTVTPATLTAVAPHSAVATQAGAP